MAMRVPSEILIAFIFLFGCFEISRWRNPDLSDVLSPVQKIRRLIGLALLLVLSIMIFGGTFFPPPILVPQVIRWIELLYWLSFSLLTVFIPLIAFFEFKDSILRGSQLRREVYKSIVTAPLDQIQNENEPPNKTKP